MNYDSRFSYNLTIPIMEIRQVTMKYDEMRHMKTSPYAKSEETSNVLYPSNVERKAERLLELRFEKPNFELICQSSAENKHTR